ncbi:MAG: DNA-binding protein [Crocosphaera sp.]|nr:DNA-binding protein [Crocosphaera sp.]
MEYVGTVKAAFLLRICPQRVRQLLAEGRIKGAFKEGRFWQIPLYNGVPKVIAGKRGPQGKWSKQRQKSLTRIHVNSNNIKNNIGSEQIEPVVIVRQGTKTFYCHQIDICGPSRIAYSPHKSLPGGARLWIEVEPEIMIIPRDFAS